MLLLLSLQDFQFQELDYSIWQKPGIKEKNFKKKLVKHFVSMEKVNKICKNLGIIPLPGEQSIPKGTLPLCQEHGESNFCPHEYHKHATLGPTKTRVDYTITLVQA